MWGYDLANEPVESPAEDLADWQELAERAAQAVRAIDPGARSSSSRPSGAVPRACVSCGLCRCRASSTASTCMCRTRSRTRACMAPARHMATRARSKAGTGTRRLETALKPAVEFQRRYDVHLYLGEFSAIRWASDDSACRYIKDLITSSRPTAGTGATTPSANGTAGASSTAATLRTIAARRRPPAAKSCCARGSAESQAVGPGRQIRSRLPART